MIESYLKDGTLDYVHIRKPEEDTDKVRRLISGIGPEAHCVSKLRLDELPAALAGKRVVALGGVTPEAFPALREAGFIGAAMLGWLW